MPEELELMHTKEDYGIEHVEIIAYRTLIQLCERLGISNAIPLLQQSMQEEQSMAKWIETNIPKLLRLYDPPKYVDSNTMLGRNELMSGGISLKA